MMMTNLLRTICAVVFVASIKSAAQQIMIVNASVQDVKVSLSPVNGYWGAKRQTGNDRDHALLWDGGWKHFLIGKGQSATVECNECATFRFMSDVAVPGLDNLTAGQTYRIEGGTPLFRISDPTGNVALTGIKTSQFSPWEEFWLHWTSNSAPGTELHIVLSKGNGA